LQGEGHMGVAGWGIGGSL